MPKPHPLRPVIADTERRLARVITLSHTLAQAPWFAACGEALTPVERQESERYLAGLGLDPAPIDGVRGWVEAAALAQRADWSRAWWEAEERAARALQQDAEKDLDETELVAVLSAVTDAAAALHGHAALAAARAGVADPALSRVAAGAAAMACHQMGLVLAAGLGEDHPLAIKYRLFAGGRWLLGVFGERCYLF
jgi:hypothetical protein